MGAPEAPRLREADRRLADARYVVATTEFRGARKAVTLENLPQRGLITNKYLPASIVSERLPAMRALQRYDALTRAGQTKRQRSRY